MVFDFRSVALAKEFRKRFSETGIQKQIYADSEHHTAIRHNHSQSGYITYYLIPYNCQFVKYPNNGF